MHKTKNIGIDYAGMIYSYLQKSFVKGLKAWESGECVEIHEFFGFIWFNRWILRGLYNRRHFSSHNHTYETFGIQYQMVILFITCVFDIVSIIFKVCIICHNLIYQYIYWYWHFLYLFLRLCVSFMVLDGDQGYPELWEIADL